MVNKSTFNIDFFLNLHLILKIKNAIPDYQVSSLKEIHQILEHSDIETIIFDIDQTIVPFGETKISDEIQKLIRNLQPKYRMCFLSNFPHTEDRIKESAPSKHSSTSMRYSPKEENHLPQPSKWPWIFSDQSRKKQ